MYKIDFVFFWYMYQLDYCDYSVVGVLEFVLFWVYLYVIKDYCDMVVYLEWYFKVCVVVNFVLVLVEQIEDYVQ